MAKLFFSVLQVPEYRKLSCQQKNIDYGTPAAFYTFKLDVLMEHKPKKKISRTSV
jgi:hypothetical protein